MSSKNITLTFESPIDELPEPHASGAGRQYQPAEHWLKIGARCFQHEGQWVPVHIDGLKSSRLASIPSLIRKGKLAAFRNWPGFEARYLNGTLYVRYIDPENHENVTELKGRTA